jgi:hypothetical protein
VDASKFASVQKDVALVTIKTNITVSIPQNYSESNVRHSATGEIPRMRQTQEKQTASKNIHLCGRGDRE